MMMAGIPGSGKSTLAKRWIPKGDTRYISRDDIRFKMIKDNEEYFSKEKEVFQEYLRQIDAAIAKGTRYIFADATHLNYSSRRKVLSQLKNKPDVVCVFYFDVPIDVALERNAQRTGKAFVPETAIRNMWNSMQFPQADEGIDMVIPVDEKGMLLLDKIVSYTKEEI
jgi:predicted kinase